MLTASREVHLLEHRSGPPVLLIPGLTFPGASWSPVCELVQDRYRLLAVDLPGHGRSRHWDVVVPTELADQLGAGR